MIKFLLSAAIVVVVPALLMVLVIPILIGFRFYYGDTGKCPDATPEFFENAVLEHFVRNGRGADDIEFIPGSHYDEELSSIAFRKGNQEYYALVDCRGSLELSGKTH